MTSDRTAVVLAGGLSVEREVSMRSGTRVADALGEAGYDVDVIDVGPTLMGELRDRRPDMVWPVLHGAAGEDGSLAELLRLLQVRTVSSTPEACRLAWDKSVACAIAASMGIAVPAGVSVPVHLLRDIGARRLVPVIYAALGPDVIVKPNSGGSSFGLSAVTEADALPEAMMRALGHDPVCRVERLVHGVEVSVTVLDVDGRPRALPAVEIEPDTGDYDFRARYTIGATEFHCPARLANSTSQRLSEQAVTIHRSLGLAVLSRSDWIIDAAGTPWFLEVNTSPGMTETSTTPLALSAAGAGRARGYADIADAAAVLTWPGDAERAVTPAVS